MAYTAFFFDKVHNIKLSVLAIFKHAVGGINYIYSVVQQQVGQEGLGSDPQHVVLPSDGERSTSRSKMFTFLCPSREGRRQ